MAVIWASDIMLNGAGMDNVMDLANLQMLMGNMGVSGGGVAPLRSQNNSQGASDMGGHPAFYPGYQSVTDKQAQEKFEAAWGVELPAQAGLSASEMMVAVDDGSLKALFILGENSWPDETGLSIRRSLEKCEFLVLCEVLSSEMSHYADVLLPGVSFAENSGTYTNTERRIQIVRQAIQPQNDSRPEWKVLSELAHRILSQGKKPLSKAIYADWNYSGTGEIMNEIAALVPIYAGVSHERLERGETLLWPVETADHPGTEILFPSQFTRGRGKFMPIGEYPVVSP
jgi:predicted molibdopterin-dependent oxidoreductase YjgC